MVKGTGWMAEMACLLEASARKPGNVHRFAAFADTRYEDFVASAAVLRRVLEAREEQGGSVGALILEAVRETRLTVGRNTNLGLVLLIVPLALAEGRDLLAGVNVLLEQTTVEDAEAVYEAIRVAAPGGLGRAEAQDVAQRPTVTLLEAMHLAADRDAVARQYATGFVDVFEIGVPELASRLPGGGGMERAVVGCHLALMAARPDTLIARKCGGAVARESAERAAAVLAAGWPDTDAGRCAIGDLDEWLRADGNRRNPGATADVVGASLFAALREGHLGLMTRSWQGADDPALARLGGLRR